MMRFLARWLGVLFGRTRFTGELDEELRFHADMLREAAAHRGATTDDAEAIAKRRLSSALRTREESRDAWGVGGIDRLTQDVRYAVRLLVRRPAFSATAIGVLALTLGASITIFSVVNAVLLRPLPFADAGRLVAMYEGMPRIEGEESLGFTATDIYEYEARQRSYTSMGAYRNLDRELSGVGEAERITVARAEWSLFTTLGTSPALGRTYTEQEDRDRLSVAVITHGLWLRKFGGDPRAVGSVLQLDRQPYTIVGVMPAGFEFPLRGLAINDTPADVFTPLSFRPSELTNWGNGFSYTVIARLKPGVDFAAAHAESEALATELVKRYPAQLLSDPRFALWFPMQPMHDAVVASVRPMLWVLLAAVLLVLLVGCADLGGLLLTRAAARANELKVRAALGAGRGRLIRQLLTESLVIATVGGIAGVALAWWATNLIAAHAADQLPRAHEIAIDGRAVFVSVGLSVLAALACGLAPALSVTQGQTLSISGNRRVAGDRGERRLLQTLVLVQVTLAMVLAIGAGLLARSLERLLAVDPGFRTAHVVSVNIALPHAKYAHAQDVRTFYHRTQQMLDELPGAQTVGMTGALPMRLFDQHTLSAEDGPGDANTAPAWVRPVSGSYFTTLGIALREGRYFRRDEGDPQAPVLIINELMAQRLWPGRSAIGRRLKWLDIGDNPPWMTVVGVVGNVKLRGLTQDVQAEMYEPYWQVKDWNLEREWIGYRRMALVVRAETEPAAMFALLRDRLHQLDPSLPVTDANSLDNVIAGTLLPQRFNTWLLSLFAATALALAALGLYGLLASFVVSRTREIGVRVALGAQRPDVLRLIASQGVRLVLIGLALGIVCAALVTRFLQSLLFGVRPLDPLTFTAVAALLLIVGLAATIVPAWRAVSIDPVRALRSE
jgi:putative ABC transport system permease protein